MSESHRIFRRDLSCFPESFARIESNAWEIPKYILPHRQPFQITNSRLNILISYYCKDSKLEKIRKYHKKAAKFYKKSKAFRSRFLMYPEQNVLLDDLGNFAKVKAKLFFPDKTSLKKKLFSFSNDPKFNRINKHSKEDFSQLHLTHS